MDVQFGQYPAPLLSVAHLSDPHLLAARRQYGVIDTAEHLRTALARLQQIDSAPDALIFTGDLADRGEPEAYRQLREIVEPVADAFGAQVIWTMGNHDERAPYALELFGVSGPEAEAPADRVHDVKGLRIIALDTTVPGYHHGELSGDQLDWLREQLSTPAEHGTILAMHHPPIPVPLTPVAAIIELIDQDRLASAIRGTDVRAIVGGHFHFTSSSMLGSVPVHVASATCYTMDPMPFDRLVSGVDAHQAFTMIHVYADRLVHSVVPIAAGVEVTGEATSSAAALIALTADERRELLSRKDSAFYSSGGGEHIR